jgi:hypothetical protein
LVDRVSLSPLLSPPSLLLPRLLPFVFKFSHYSFLPLLSSLPSPFTSYNLLSL